VGALLAPSAAATPGALDPSFGVNGLAHVPSAAVGALDASGRLLCASGGGNGTVALYRLTTAGAVDPTFGVDGIAELPIGPSSKASEQIAGLYVERDGAIVIAGNSDEEVPGNQGRFTREGFVARVADDGTVLDASFGEGGVAWLPLESEVSGLAENPHGRPVVAGSIVTHSKTFFDAAAYLARLTPAGRLDPTFGTDGAVVGLGGHWGTVERIAAVTVSGNTVMVTSEGPSMLVARYDEHGRLLRTFGVQGIFRREPEGVASPSEANEIAAIPGGGVLLAGRMFQSPDVYVARLTSTGRLDKRFGSDGVAVLDLRPSPPPDPGGERSEADALLLEPGGKIVLVGAAEGASPICYSGIQIRAGCTPPTSGSLVIARLAADGTLDPTFGAAGLVRESLSAEASGQTQPYVTVAAAAIDSQDRLIVDGNLGYVVGNWAARFLLAG
jgi:uncharacterized delta-60 repeat protein